MKKHVSLLPLFLISYCCIPCSAFSSKNATIIQPQLQGNITLNYQCIEKDVRGNANKADSEHIQELQYFAAVKRGEMTQQQADEALAIYHNALKPDSDFVSTITISISGSKLLYKEVTSTSRNILIYDGSNSYMLNAGAKSAYDLKIVPGLDVLSFFRSPLPGTGFPHLPLYDPNFPLQKLGNSNTYSAHIVRFNVESHKAVFSPGRIIYEDTSGHNIIKNLDVLRANGNFAQKWKFLRYKNLQNQPIASTIEWIQYSINGTPETNRQYQLLGSSLEPIAEIQFDPIFYLSRASVVYDNNLKGQVVYTYSVSGGSLADQREHARISQERLKSAALNGHIPSRNYSALFVFIGLIIFGIAYYAARLKKM